MEKPSNYFNKILYYMLAGMFSVVLGLMTFQQQASAEEVLPVNTPMVVLSDSEGNSLVATEEEFNKLSEDSLSEGIENVKQQLTIIRSLQPKILNNVRTVSSPIFGDWSNWQKDIKFNTTSGGFGNPIPTNIGTNRWRMSANKDLTVVEMGDTYGGYSFASQNMYVFNVTNPTTTTWTITGDTDRLFASTTRGSEVVANRIGMAFSKPGTATEYGHMYTVSPASRTESGSVYWIPYYPNKSISFSGIADYSTDQKNGYNDNSIAVTRLTNYQFISPQIVKSVHKDIDTGADLGHAGDVGRGGYMGDSIQLTSVSISGYHLDHQQYIDENGVTTNSDSNVWTGTLNGTKRGVVFWYKKNEPELSVTKAVDKPEAKVGETLNYTIEAKNTGTANATDIVYTDILPAGLEKPTTVALLGNTGIRYPLEEGEGNANSSGGYYTWNETSRTLTVYAKNIDVNMKKSLVYTTKVLSGSDGDKLKNIVTLTGSNTSDKPTAEATVTVVGEPNLSVTKTANKETVKVGETVSYRVNAKNDGNARAKSPGIKDILPAGMGKPTNVKLNGSIVMPEGEENANASGQYYTWNATTRELSIQSRIASDPSSGVWYYTYDSTVETGNDGDVLKNKVTLGASNTTQRPTAEATVTIVGEPNLSVTKTANKETVKVGETVSYRVNAKNDGNARAKSPGIKDILPAGMGKPTNVKLNGSITMPEGEENANANGQYYTWNATTRELSIQSRIASDPSSGVWYYTYDSTVETGNDGDVLKNKVTLGASNTTQRPTAEATVTIVGEPNLSVTKTANKESVKVGETISYTVVGENTGNATLNESSYTDVLPSQLEKPTNITLIGATGIKYPLLEGKANANSAGGYYTWDEASHTLTVFGGDFLVNQKRELVYDAKVGSGNDGDSLVNVVTWTGSNTTQRPTADATVMIVEQDNYLHVKQEIMNKHEAVVMPTMGSLELSNVNTTDHSLVNSTYTITIPSYQVDTNQSFKSTKVQLNHEYDGYLLEINIPEFYEYVGYQITIVEQTHQSSNIIKEPIPVLDYSQQREYWVTIYLQPKVVEDGPPYYNWDYKTNDFGTIAL